MAKLCQTQAKGVLERKVESVWIAEYLSHAAVKVLSWYIDVFIGDGVHWWQIDFSLLSNCLTRLVGPVIHDGVGLFQWSFFEI